MTLTEGHLTLASSFIPTDAVPYFFSPLHGYLLNGNEHIFPDLLGPSLCPFPICSESLKMCEVHLTGTQFTELR